MSFSLNGSFLYNKLSMTEIYYLKLDKFHNHSMVLMTFKIASKHAPCYHNNGIILMHITKELLQ